MKPNEHPTRSAILWLLYDAFSLDDRFRVITEMVLPNNRPSLSDLTLDQDVCPVSKFDRDTIYI